MTMKQRIMTALKRGMPDRIPWAPRLHVWYASQVAAGTLPERYVGWTMFDILRDIGAGVWYNFQPKVFCESLHNVEVRTTKQDGSIITEYATPVGTVSTKHVWNAAGPSSTTVRLQTEYMVKQEADYDAALYIVENTEILPNYEPLLRVQEQVGEDGVVLAKTGHCPMHRLMLKLLGYEHAVFELHDRPALVEQLLSALERQAEEIQRVALQSPADVIEVGGNWNEMTPPPLFAKYFVPYHREFADKIHAAGKLASSHVDGELQGLMDLFLETGIDIAESFTPTPMTSVSVAEARWKWDHYVAIVGGVCSTMLSDTTDEATFEAFMEELFTQIAPGDAFVLGTGDVVPADAKFERLLHISEMVDAYGSCPMAGMTAERLD
jgi:hypothetical protein